MNKISKIFYILISLVFLVYLLLPAPDYPTPPDGFLRSTEPADIESDLRRGYYTDLEREEVMQFYVEQFKTTGLNNLQFPTYRLNYPPEEAQTIIRDQTRSTFLEEIVHPFRESVFINGFKPTKDNEVIIVDGYNWNQKIIVKMITSDTLPRLFIGVITLVVGWVLITEYFIEADTIKSIITKIKTK